ncbi:MAG: amidase family protein [Bryobacteraceae bacterium]
MTLLEAAAALRRRETSSVELTEGALDRIARLNPVTNAILTVMAESARAQALQADAELARGQGRGPLHGIPVALKDLFYTKGVRTTGGSKLFAQFVPDHDAAVVESLAGGGAVLGLPAWLLGWFSWRWAATRAGPYASRRRSAAW